MSSVSTNCPHCRSAQSSFNGLYEFKSMTNRFVWWMTAFCGVCKEPAIIQLFDTEHASGRANPDSPLNYGIKNSIVPRFQIYNVYPSVQDPSAPDSVPDAISGIFLEAEKSLQSGLLSGAASCYRKCVERTVKHVFPEGTGMLNARIREIEKKGQLPKTMVELLDHVRLLGNSTMHEEEYDPSVEDCRAASEFTSLLLTYLFTLPNKIAEAQKKLMQAPE